jgi:NAD(P)-dependent dehydrogenase (short-subunit alcohol dehydrogenase family)
MAEHIVGATHGESLVDRAAIVSGGSRGIGKAIAARLAEAGARVVVAARSEDSARVAAAEIAGRGGEALGVACDVRVARDVEHLVARTLESFERVDIVVNNAGISPVRAEPHEISEADWNAIIDTNLKGAFLLSTAAARSMMDRGNGAIINIASIAGVTPIPLESAYCASKAGMIGLTKALARDWARYGIRVHAVAPGYIATEMNAEVRQIGESLTARGINATTPGLSVAEANAVSTYSGVVARTLLGRYGLPEEVAEVVAYLASDRAAYMTGSVTFVDGGWTIGDGAAARVS